MKIIIALILSITFFEIELSANETDKDEASGGLVESIEFIPGKGVLIEKLQEITAVVLDIDYQNRLLTIIDPGDVQTTFTITQTVDDINKIKNGDSVILTGYLGIVMQLVDSIDDIDQSSVQLLSNELSDQKLDLIDVDIVQRVAEITEIDYQTRTITIADPEGRFIDLIVPEFVKKYDDLNIGDMVSVAYLQAFAISVQVVDG